MNFHDQDTVPAHLAFPMSLYAAAHGVDPTGLEPEDAAWAQELSELSELPEMVMIHAFLRSHTRPRVWGSDVDGYKIAHRQRAVELLGESLADWVLGPN